MASDRAFAFAALLTSESAGSCGHVRFQPAGGISDGPGPTLDAFAAALAGRLPLRWLGAGGEWTVEWR